MQGVKSHTHQHAFLQHPLRWAEAALIYHTVSLDNEQEIVDLREAMAISHTEAQAAPRPAPQDMTVQELRARYVSSAVLQAVQAVCGEEDVLQGPLRPPLLEVGRAANTCMVLCNKTVVVFARALKRLSILTVAGAGAQVQAVVPNHSHGCILSCHCQGACYRFHHLPGTQHPAAFPDKAGVRPSKTGV